MNGIYGMELEYESLIPIDRPKDTFLSIGTVTFLMEGKELPLDFNITEGGTEGSAGSIIRLNALLRNLNRRFTWKNTGSSALRHLHWTMAFLQTAILPLT